MLGQGNRANSTIGRALQLVGAQRRRRQAAERGPRRARADGQGRDGCFAERLTRTRRGRGSRTARGVAAGETGVTLFAGEAPRADRGPAGARRRRRCARRWRWRSSSSPRREQRLDVRRAAASSGPSTDACSARRAGSARGAGRAARAHHGARASRARRPRLAEGVDRQFVSDPEMPVAKFAAPERILLAYAGGDAGCSAWSSAAGRGEMGSRRRSSERGAMAHEDPRPDRRARAVGRPLAPRGGRRDRAARHPQAARRRLPGRARARCCASAA